MEKEKLSGSTSEHAEVIVDYENNKTAMKGLRQENFGDRTLSIFSEWFGFTLFPAVIIIIILISFFNVSIKIVSITYAVILLGLTCLHSNKKFDRKMMIYFATRQGDKKRNRVIATDIQTKDFTIYNTRNIITDYDTTGDVRTQLSKVWIKQEHPISALSKQARIKDFLLLENNPVWNVHFLFKNVPKDGELILEYI